MNKLSTILAASLALMLGTVSSSALAEEDAAIYSDYRIMTIKYGRGNEFVKLMTRMASAMDEIGSPPVKVWSEVRGNTTVYHHIRTGTLKRLFDDILAYGGPPMEPLEWDVMTTMVSDTIESQKRFLIKHETGLNLLAADDAEPARYRRVQIDRIAEGGNVEYAQWLQEDLVPTLENAGVQGVEFSRVIQGESPNVWITTSDFTDWRELEEPGAITDELSAKENPQQFSIRHDDLTESSKVVLLRRIHLR